VLKIQLARLPVENVEVVAGDVDETLLGLQVESADPRALEQHKPLVDALLPTYRIQQYVFLVSVLGVENILEYGLPYETHHKVLVILHFVMIYVVVELSNVLIAWPELYVPQRLCRVQKSQ